MKDKHTPGPWAIVNREIRGPAESGVIVARIPEWGVAADCPDSFTANARLIAAAPDLLEACWQALTHIESDECTHGRPFAAGNVLRAAIAKAEQGA